MRGVGRRSRKIGLIALRYRVEVQAGTKMQVRTVMESNETLWAEELGLPGRDLQPYPAVRLPSRLDLELRLNLQILIFLLILVFLFLLCPV